MLTIDEQDLIDRVTRRLQMMLVVSVAGLLVMLIVFALLQPKGAGGGRRGQWAIPSQAAGTNAGHPPAPAPAPAYQGDILGWLVVAAAGVSLTLSVFLPRWIVTRSQWQIAAGTWYSQSRRWVGEDGRLDELLRHAAIRSDRGQLAYVCTMQYSFRGLLIPALWFAVMVYMSTKSPIALAAGVLLACGLVAWFPTRTRVANWIDRQEEALIQERQLAVIKPPQGTRIGKGLQEPLRAGAGPPPLGKGRGQPGNRLDLQRVHRALCLLETLRRAPGPGGVGRLAVSGSLHPDWRRHARGVRDPPDRGHQVHVG